MMPNISFRVLQHIFCAGLSIFLQQIAQAQELSFNSWNTEDGLSQNTVYSICQDKLGFIWIGTGNGVNRFDGNEFKQYNLPRKDNYPIGENDINALLADDDFVWIGMQTGLLLYNLKTGSFQEAHTDDKTPLTAINCVIRGSGNVIWVGTDIGLFVTSGNDKLVFKRFGRYDDNSLPAKAIRCLFQDKLQNIWVGTSQGLTRIATQNKSSVSYTTYRNDPENPTSVSSNIVTAIAGDGSDNIWVGTQSRGVNLLNAKTGIFTCFNTETQGMRLINNNVRVIKTDSDGNIWVGTQEGISKIDLRAHIVSNYKNDPLDKNSLSQNSVHSLFIDRNNFVWAGTFFGGLNLINPFPSDFKVWQNNGTPSGLSNNVVSSVTSDDNGNLWIGTEGGGINYYNAQSKTFSYYTENSGGVGSNLIKTIFKDKDGNIWIGTHAGGLNLYSNGSFKKYFRNPENPSFLLSEIATIEEDAQTNLWLGLQGGIQDVQVYHRIGTSLTDISAQFDRTAIKRKNIKKIFADSKNNIWIGTSRGLFIIPHDKKTAFPVNKADAVGTSQISGIQEDSWGNIWFGVEHHGLSKYDPLSRKIYTYQFKKNGKENDVFGILEDRNHLLWLSTNNGLIKMDPVTAHFQIYTKTDGLPSNAFNYNAYYKDDSGIFYFGSYKGLTSFNPTLFFENNTNTPIVFTGLKTLNQTKSTNINLSKELKITHKENVFTIEFALLNYIKPKKNSYAYILKGFDSRWTETDKPSVTYMNLKPGKYILAVKGANNDGRWSATKELSIIILPPFWKTWWAYAIYAVIFSTLLFFIIRFFYLRALIKKEEALHQYKLDFFTNVTHEIRTHLTLIMSPVDKMIHDRAEDGYLQQQFQNIKKNAGNLLRLSEELMDFRKAETENMHLCIAPHDIVGFVKEIYEQFRELSLARDIHISFTHDVSSFTLYFDKEQLEKVFFNLLSNAFKFTPDGGRVQVHIKDEHPYIKVSVIDNGRGIAPEYKDKLFNNFFQINDIGSQNKGYGIGLALSSKIAALHGAKIEVDSTLADDVTGQTKTIFAVFLQKGKAHFNDSAEGLEPKVVIDATKKIDVADLAGKKAVPGLLEKYLSEKSLSVLVVDDNIDIQNTIYEILSDHYTVLLRENAAKGWAYATAQIPDLIISDVMMPDEDGLSFCHRIKSDLRTCHIPVILLTAKTTQQDHIDGLGRGADIYLTKPFHRRVLELNVRNLLVTRERIREHVQLYVEDGLKQIASENEAPSAPTMNALDSAFLNDINAIIEKNLDDPTFNVSVLAYKIGMSIPVLYKKVKAVTNLSVNDFIKSIKLQKAAELLRQNNMAVYEVCYAVGFQDRKHFGMEFKKKFGKTPKQYAQSGLEAH